jgi:glycosyltransferase involved in cell wall biosynthesis
MKICFACYQSVMLIRGGPHVKILQTKKHLEKLGVNVELFNMWKSAEKISDYDLFHLFSANLGVYHIARSLWERKIKFVVNPIFYTRRSGATVRRICWVDKFARKLIRGVWWDYGMFQDICQWAEMVLPNTKAEGNLISEGMGIPQEKIRVIHNGVSKEFLDGDPNLFKEKYGFENYILNVGHIGPDRKNILALIKALSNIDHPSVIIGRITPGGESNQILAESKKNKNILIIDGLDHSSLLLASAYTACDVFVLPSKFETPGRAALEAGLAGAKIVITPHGGTKEYFGDMAEYVDPYSVESIKKGIERSLNKKKSTHLREHIKNNFLWDKIAVDTLAVYKEVLD